ncbi:MAG: site-2 protease family protein, partial [Dehalococcoidia bacterium]|nr:site-2 protease family protein [Dehalococcoidia bacterium]
MRSSFKLGEILGIPFLINYTWFIIFVFVTVTLALFYFPPTYPDWPQALYWVIGVAASLLFFGSVLGHELAHSMVARSQDIPVKSITLFVFGGVSRITKEATTPGKEAILAAAGPLSSVVFGGFFVLVYLATRGVSEPIAALSFYLAYINFLLAAFNMIPGFPMDGGRVFRSFLWWITKNYRRATHIASLTGQGIAYAFIAGGILSIFFIPGFLVTGIWFALIGWFLENAASGSYRQMMLKEALQGFKARDVMTQDCALVSPSLSVRALVNEYILPTSRRCFVVSDA